ncbi:RNB domain-containing ribonuclease [Gephyromycinifex aptenodytis]|uniref:RNB domain-containing ribonuclease n=1 Tax=Gephyromycinifex aptenodytis TaxID=2716227 RepID=UPI001447344D|nr:RNB domain-containing ribonuclease [Gephyromycinifex aptenodytis]
MPSHRVTLLVPSGESAASGQAPLADPAPLRAAFARIRQEYEVPSDFPADVLAEARQVASNPTHDDLPDLRDVPFFTIDPAGSMDLDQAMALERLDDGYRVRYAIADVPAVVRLGGAIDAEARRRGQTIYLPDGRSPLHPPVLSEDAASLLPGQDRSAFVWDLELGSDGEPRRAQVARARVRSRRRWDYQEAQAAIDQLSAAGEPAQSQDLSQLALLREIGQLRIEAERVRGGASLPMPEQEVHAEVGGYRLRFRPPVPAEEWNAQISLLTGMAAASIMLEGGVGLLRTMPTPQASAIATFRRQAEALGVSWPAEVSYGELLRGLDRDNPAHLALVHEATSLFRGAGYTPFEGQPPEQPLHAAVAAPYAHVTAPLRRLVDRFGLLVCAALCAGEEVPAQVREILPLLPDLMRTSDQRASAVDRACTDAVEAAELAGRVGQEFPAVVVDDRGAKGLLVQVLDPAVVAPCEPGAELGSRVRVRLEEADIQARSVRFSVSG